MICVWEISCKLKLIKCIIPTDKPYYYIPGYCPLSGKHFFFFFAQTASSNLTSYHMHQPFIFPPVTCSLKETYLAITENITMNHPRFQKSRFQEIPIESVELWQPLCCVCVYGVPIGGPWLFLFFFFFSWLFLGYKSLQCGS